MMTKRLVIIDGNSLINRAYYAIQKPMITKEGLYTHGVYGFLNMLTKILGDYEPGYLTVAFDRKAPTFRHQEYAEYKAGRKKMPPELAMQLPLLKEVLTAMKIPILEIDGYEADDIIGTVARTAEEAGMEPFIITGDKDALQLATKVTSIIITRKGITDFDRYDEDAFIEKYGFTPTQFIDCKGLMGDQSDNIPGIPGVGEKTAQKLIMEYGTVANLIACMESIPNQKLREKVETYAQQALMSRRLAEINTHVPIDFELESFVLETPDYGQLIELYKKLEFNSFLKRLPREAFAYDPSGGVDCTVEIPELPEPDEVVLCDFDCICRVKEELNANVPFVFKVFHNGDHKDIPKLQGAAFLTEKTYCYLPQGPDFVNTLKEILTSAKAPILGHQLQEDIYALYCNGFEDWDPEILFDTAIAQYLIEPSRSEYSLNGLSIAWLSKDLPKPEDFMAGGGQLDLFSMAETPQEPSWQEYGKAWCLCVRQLWPILQSRLEGEDLIPIFKQVELPLIPVLSYMEARGFAADREELVRAGEALSSRIDELTAAIYEAAGDSFNINSPKQLGEVLFERLGLPFAKKTKTGYATGAEILEKLRPEHPIIDLILEYRSLTKLKGTYIDGLLPLIHKDGRIHAHFQQTVTATGRISCTEPNLQNIPIRQENGRLLRKAFIPESEDYVLVGADYSQIELRVLAHMSQDPELIQAFNEGQDIHRLTASRIFNTPFEEVTSLQRSNAKAVNFGVIYGMSGFGLSAGLNITRRDAEKYIEEYFKKYTSVKDFMDKQIADCKEHGFVTTILGRRRRIPEISASNYMVRQSGERLAMNTPIQGSAADIIKLAMIHCHKALRDAGLRSGLILQVHDELIIQAHKDELEKVKMLLVETMEHALELSVSLTVDLNTGNNWYELK